MFRRLTTGIFMKSALGFYSDRITFVGSTKNQTRTLSIMIKLAE